MSREETSRLGSSVSKRRRLEDRGVDSGSDDKVDFNLEDNAGVGIHGMYKLLHAVYTASRFARIEQVFADVPVKRIRHVRGVKRLLYPVCLVEFIPVRHSLSLYIIMNSW